jgi:hypothetical protein
MGKWIYHGGWYPNYQMRLFHKKFGFFTGDLVHEKVQINGNISYLKYPIKHYSYKNIADHIKHMDHYSSLYAQENFNKGRKSSILYSFLKGISKFITMYYFRLGILDGKQGFILAILGFFYNFLKYIKLYEIQLSKKKNLD